MMTGKKPGSLDFVPDHRKNLPVKPWYPFHKPKIQILKFTISHSFLIRNRSVAELGGANS